MKTSIDIRIWNLGVATTLLACGDPPVDADGDGTGTDDTGATTGTNACESYADCPPGYQCYAGVCEPGGYTTSYCGDGRGACWYYDCFTTEECAAGSLCVDMYCVEPSLPPECDMPLSFAEIPLPDLGVLPTSIHFVGDISPGAHRQDLVVMHDAGFFVVHDDLSVDEIPLDSPAHAVVVADANADDREDLIVSRDDGKAQVFLADGPGGFAPQLPISSATADLLAAVDFNGDGNDDAIACSGEGCLVWLSNDFGGLSTTPGPSVGTSVAVSGLESDGVPGSDVLFLKPGDFGAPYLWVSGQPLGSASPLPSPIPPVAGARIALFATNGIANSEFAVLTPFDGDTLASFYYRLVDNQYSQAANFRLSEASVSAVTQADFGASAIVLGSASQVQILRQLDSPCSQSLPASHAVEFVASADFDGDELHDLAMTDGETLTLWGQTP